MTTPIADTNLSRSSLAAPAPRKRLNLWPLAIIGYFAVVIASIIVFVFWAVRQDFDLVRPDYYEHEILYQRQIDAIQRTQPLAAQIAIGYRADERRIEVRLPAAHAAASPVGTVRLYRPARAALDREFALTLDHAGLQQLDARGLEPGLWKIQVSWRAQEQDYFFAQAILAGESAATISSPK